MSEQRREALLNNKKARETLLKTRETYLADLGQEPNNDRRSDLERAMIEIDREVQQLDNERLQLLEDLKDGRNEHTT